jgi:phage-related protein
MSGNWSQAWTDFKDMLVGVWEGIKTYLSGAIDMVKGYFSLGWYALKDIIGKPFTDAWAQIAGVFDNIHNAINTLTGQGPAVVANTSQIMTGIHHFASGIENFGGGLAYVHAGEILTYLPKGSSVIPASTSAALLGGGATIHLTVNVSPDLSIDGRRMADALMPYTVNTIRNVVGARI